MSTTTTPTGRIRDISVAGASVEFGTSGIDNVQFSALVGPGATVGSVVLTVQIQLSLGIWQAVPTGAVTVNTNGTLTASIAVLWPRMRVYVSTAGTSGVVDVYMHGRTAV